MKKERRSNSIPYKRLLRSRYDKIKSRCYNPNSPAYKNYGGRGIKMCNEWFNDFYKFYDWALDNSFHPSLTLERINVNGDYNPSNCKWATMKEQSLNKRNSIKLTYKETTKNISEWADDYGVQRETAYGRYHAGMSFEEIFKKDINYKFVYIEYKGQRKKLRDWAKELNIEPSNLKYRLDNFNTVEEAFEYKQPHEIIIEYDGESKTLLEWSKKLNIKYGLLRQRYWKGWNNKEIIEGRKRKTKRKTLSYNGDVFSIIEWSEITKSNYKTMCERNKKYNNVEDVIFGFRNRLTNMKNYLRYKRRNDL